MEIQLARRSCALFTLEMVSRGRNDPLSEKLYTNEHTHEHTNVASDYPSTYQSFYSADDVQTHIAPLIEDNHSEQRRGRSAVSYR